MNEILRHLYLVDIIFERLRSIERDFTGLTCRSFIESLSAQEFFRFPCPPGYRRDSAHHDPRIAHHSSGALDDRGNRNYRVIPSKPFAHLVVKAFTAGLGDRHVNFRHDFPWVENIFPLVINRRQDEKFLQGNRLFTRRACDFDLRTECHQCGRGIRRMDDVAWSSTEDGVETAVARNRVANLSAFAQAIEVRGTEIPAKRSLADIAGDGAGVTNLR